MMNDSQRERSLKGPVSGRAPTVECYYPRCDFEGTQHELDEHLAAAGTDPDHDWPTPVGQDPRLTNLGTLPVPDLDTLRAMIHRTSERQQVVAAYNEWEAKRAELESREPHDYPSASEWEANDDEGIQILRHLVAVLKDEL
jgi:hypothetical protein